MGIDPPNTDLPNAVPPEPDGVSAVPSAELVGPPLPPECIDRDRGGRFSSGSLLRWYVRRRSVSDFPGFAGWLIFSPSLVLRAGGKAVRIVTSKVRRRESDPTMTMNFSSLGGNDLKTERLVLRPVTTDALDRLADLFPSGQLGQPWPGRPPTPTWWCDLAFLSDLTNNSFTWMIARQSDGIPVGVCAVGWYAVEGFEGAELGYWIGKEFRERGYATEAAKAVLNRCLRRQPRVRVASFIAPENQPSVRVAEKVGLVFQRQTDFRGGAILVYAAAEPPSG